MADSYRIGGERAADGAATIVRISGELDITARDDLREALLLALSDGDVIVDLDATSFIDSEALGALIDAFNASRTLGAGFRVINSHDVVDRVLTVSGAKDLFGT